MNSGPCPTASASQITWLNSDDIFKLTSVQFTCFTTNRKNLYRPTAGTALPVPFPCVHVMIRPEEKGMLR